MLVSPDLMLLFLCLSSGVQLQNSLKSDLCLDQGPETENVPIVYICHGMTPQVSVLRSPCRVCACVCLVGKEKLNSVVATLGPWTLGAFH